MREKVEHPHGLRQQWWRLPAAPLIVVVALALVGDATASSPVAASTPSADPRDTPVLTRLEVSQGPETAPSEPLKQRTRRYLTRQVARSARYLDHGVLGVALGVGTPQVYRLEVALGLLDHLTLGVTGHWLPGERAPRWAPKGSVAFFRGRLIEVGASYHQLLYPPTPDPEPTPDDPEPMTVTFPRRAHYLLGNISLSQAWFTVGVDIGWARGREAVAFITEKDIDVGHIYDVRNRLGAGLHLRLGTRRVGLLAQVNYPYTAFELALDLRFGLFELRSRGGWWQF